MPANAPDQADEWVSTKTLAAETGIQAKTFDRWRDEWRDGKRGRGPVWFKVPGTKLVRYLRSDVEAWKRLGIEQADTTRAAS